jgi:hypothetical protein
MENGDDWFYFEDDSTSPAAETTANQAFRISTISGSETEMMRLRYKSQPKHTVLHKGGLFLLWHRNLVWERVFSDGPRGFWAHFAGECCGLVKLRLRIVVS